jgi:hypothetical protein
LATNQADNRQLGENRIDPTSEQGPKNESCSTRTRPIGKFVGQRRDFVSDLLDAVDPGRHVTFNQPVPESGTKVEPVVQILAAMNALASRK